MALSVLLPSHDSYVKEEESDDIEFSQESADLMATGIVSNLQSFLNDRSNGEMKEEMEDQAFKEAENNALIQGLMASVIPASVIVAPSDDVKMEELPFKEEPIDIEKLLHLSRGVTGPMAMNHPGFGIDALLSLAAGQDHSLGLQSGLLDKVAKEEFDDDMGEGSPLPETSSKRRQTLKYPSPDSEEDRIYMSAEHLPRTKRGRPKGIRYSEEEVAADPKKRRQAHNREAALRYREKKKLETWGMQHTVKQLEHKKACLTETVDDISREVQVWRRRCLKAFSFYPICKFEERSFLDSLDSLSRRSLSTSESLESLSPSPDQLEFNRWAAVARFRAKKKEQYALLQQEEAQLDARNSALRAEALKLFIDIIDLRDKMGVSNVRTTADQCLPMLLHSNQFSSTQISNLLHTTQS